MTAESPFRSFFELSRPARFVLALLAGAAVALSVRLWPDWRQNPDLSHGLLMPVVFAILVHDARRGTPRFLPTTLAVRFAFGVLLGLALLSLVAAGLYAASVDWSHPLVNLSLATALVAFLGAGLLLFSQRGYRFIGCNWPAFAAIVLWWLCTPIPPGTYSRLTITLQLWVSEAVLRTLHLLGVAAIRHGNIIELARGTVGVEEACSGIRSLVSCVFAGLFLSATLVHGRKRRAIIIALAAPLALGMNFLRSLILTLLVNAGIDIEGTWHDLTGFAVLGVTAALLAGLALLLDRLRSARAAAAATADPATLPPPRVTRPSGQLAVLMGALGVAGLLVLVSVANTRPSARRDAPAPDLAALLPATAPGWQVSTPDDLYQFRDTLQTDDLAQRTYRRPAADGSLIEVILYVAYWKPGQAPVSLVASHTPDACWPGSGWTAQPVAHPTVTLHVDGRELAPAEHRSFTFGSFPQHVWFWHLYDGRPIVFRDPYSALALLRIAWRYGFRHDGDQLFVRVSSNRPWSELNEDPLIRAFFARTRTLGL